MVDFSLNDSAAELERLRFALQSAQIGTWTLDVQRQQVWWDARCKELYGFRQDDSVPYDQVLSYMHQDDRSRVNEAVQSALDPQSGGHYDVQFRTVGADDGQIRWLHCRGRADFNADGVAYRFAGTAQDVTQQVVAQQALQQSEARFQNLVREANVGMNVLLGQELRVTVVNEAYGQIIGHRLDEMLGRPLFELIPDAESYFRPLLEQVMATGEPLAQQEVPYRLRSASGQLIEGFIDYLYQPYREADGRITGVMTMISDVTKLVNSRQTIARSEAKMRALIQEAPVATCLFVGRELRIELANPMMLNVWGRDQSVLGKPLAEAVPELQGQPFLAILNEVFTSGQAYRSREARAELAVDGVLGTYYFDFTYKPLFNAAGEVYAIMDMAVDVTQPVMNRLALARQQTHLQNAIDIGDLGTFEIDVRTQTASFSERLGRWFNLMPPTQPVAHFLANVHRDDQGLVQRALDESVRDQCRHDITYRIVDGQGTTTHYLRSIGEAQFIDSQPGSISGMIQDVTEQVQARRKLEESEARFRSIVQQSPAATLVLRGDDYVIDQINQPMLAFMGRGQEVMGQPLLAIMPELAGQFAWQQVQRVYQEGVSFDQFELAVPHNRTGIVKDYYYNVAYRPLREGEQIRGMIQVATDVTEQVESRRKLEESEARFRSIVQQSPAATLVLRGEELVIDQINQPMLSFMGRDQEVIGHPLVAAVPELDGQDILQQARRVYTEGVDFNGYEVLIPHARTGVRQDYYYDLSYRPLLEGGQRTGVIQVVTDVTAQVLARQQLAVTEARLRTIITHLPSATVVFRGRELVVETPSQYFIDIIDRGPDVEGKPLGELMPELESQSFLAILDQVFTSGQSFRAFGTPVTIHQADGSTTNDYFDLIYTPLFDREEQVYAILSVATNVTDIVATHTLLEESETRYRLLAAQLEQQVKERTAELLATNQELAASNEQYAAINEELEESNSLLVRSNENLQTFAYIASHDLQEPLRKIQQFGNLLQLREGEGRLDAESAGYVARMQTAASRMSTLIKDLLNYSRISTQRNSEAPVSLNKVVGTVLDTLDMTISQSNAQVQVDVLPIISGDAVQLGQLFQNLLSNALKFHRPDAPPRIHIRSELIAAEDLPARVNPARRSPTYECIQVIDNGIGFEEKYLDRIFQVFQRLHGKNEFAGTGVGLAICEKVVTNHGGAISARSQPGQGAKFSVYLPVNA